MLPREEMFDEFFKHRLPDDGFTLEEVYEEYFGLMDMTMEAEHQESPAPSSPWPVTGGIHTMLEWLERHST